MSTKNTFLKNLGALPVRARLSFMEGLYSVHIKVRYIHDKSYQRVNWYKVWTDKGYSHAVHRAALAAFIFSFLLFAVL